MFLNFIIVCTRFIHFFFTAGVKHPKTTSNLLKPMEQSNISTKELEIIFDVELVTKENPKTFTKLSKCIKKQKLLLNNQRKQKLKASDRTLKLDIIKIHIRTKKCSLCNEIKLIYSKKYTP